MGGINIPVGRFGFVDIRQNGYNFVDKSGCMLSEFFDIRKDSKIGFHFIKKRCLMRLKI
mgnify:CR=1 FL=1